MRKLSIKVILILTFISLNIYSQNYTFTLSKSGYIQTTTYYPTKSNPSSTITVYNNNTPYVGTQFISGSGYERDNILRTTSYINLATSLNLQANEQISLAKLTITTQSSTGSGNFNINFVGTSFSGSGPQDFWLKCKSGTNIGSLPYNSSNQYIDVTNYVSNNLNNTIYFGFYEGGDGKAYLNTVTLQIWTITVPQVNITAQNNFTGGSIKVGVNTTATSHTSPFPFTAYVGNSVNLQAVEQSKDSYSMIWNDTEAPLNPSKWDRNGIVKSYNQSYSFSASTDDNDKTYTSNLRKICNQNFTNSFVGLSYKGTMKVNGTSYNCPTQDFGVVEQNTISFQPILYQVQNGIGYLFNHWDDGVTTSIRTVNPIAHKTYTAYYVGKADNSYRHLQLNGSDPTGTPVRLTWYQHPNTNITKYEIWRKVGFNITAVGYKIATINRSNSSTYTYTDNEYSISHVINKDNEVSYDVKAYYSVENTLSQDDYVVTYGTPEAKENSGSEAIAMEKAVENEITENEVSNYPNPFNPTTTINFKVKEEGNVNITIYDALGREVKQLVNETKQPGSYQVSFDGSKLSSGIYFYSMRVNNFIASKKMLLTK